MITLQKTIDPRVNINSQLRRKYSVLESGTDISFISFRADGGVSTSQMNFTATPPSNTVFINRQPIITMKFRLTFSGTSAIGVTLLQASGTASNVGVSPGTARYDAPRCAPMSQILNNVLVTLNNDRLSQNYSAYSKVFQRYNSTLEMEDGYNSMYPSMPDTSQAYSDYSMSNRSELGGYAEGQKNIARGGFVGTQIISNGNGVACTSVVELEVSEYLNISPFNTNSNYICGLYGINNLNISLSLSGKSNLALGGLAGALWSHSTSSASTFTGVVVDVLEASVNFSYITPPALEKIEPVNYYPYNELVIFPTSSTTPVTTGSTVLLTMNSIQLNSIPECIYVWADKLNSTCDFTTTDTYLNMLNLSVSFDNRDALLSNASSLDLYRMAQHNGCNLSWTQWSKQVGSPLRINFGSDVPLRVGSYVGTRGGYNLRLQATFKNTSALSITPVLNVLVVSEGIITINNGVVSRSVGVLDQNVSIADLPEVQYKPMDSVYGGKFVFDDIKKFFKDHKILSKSGRFISDTFLPPGVAKVLANKAVDLLESRGYGLEGSGIIGGGVTGGGMTGGQMVKYKKKSKKMTRKQMMNLM